MKRIIKVYKYKLKPTVKQKIMLNQAIGCARYIYNWGLALRKTAYEKDKTRLTYIDTAKELTKLKQKEEYKWLRESANESLQQSLRCLDAAFTNFFRDKSIGYPKFKSKKNGKDVVKYINHVYFDFDNWKVKIPKIGWVKLLKNKSFDQSIWTTKTLTVTRDRCGDYWCTIVCHADIEDEPKTKVSPQTTVGIDVGIKTFAILSDGTQIENPKFTKHAARKLAILQRKFARTKKDSKRHEVMRLKIARYHRRVANRRNNFLHKLTTSLIQNYNTICIENLKIRNMVKNHRLAGFIQDASWYEFKRQLLYKADWYGKNVLQVDTFYPSSKICSKCGYKNDELKLSDRVWICPECGMVLDRDLNAAENIKKECLTNYKAPSASGVLGGEGNDISHPAKRQNCKPCETQ